MKEKIKLLYRIIIVIVTAIGLYLNFKFLTFEKGILYFTNLSNLFCLIYFTVLVILMVTKKTKNNDMHYIIKGMITMSITLTMVVYNLLISSSSAASTIFENHQFECNLVHIVVPLLVIFDYIIFGEKGHLKKEYPLIWSFVLIAYQAFVVIYTANGGTFINGATYPYPFMDIDTYGAGKVTINMIVTFIFFLGYGNIIQLLDNKLGEKANKNLTKNKKIV